ncbi:MAG: DegT/DnrJ/EryC1/StrS family aminotransferase [Candidatus Caldipriscus sp.]|nr:DegT/DnrJ/EryC1/StrS family aminotransferase [Candidatus Caldipriscus sp.]
MKIPLFELNWDEDEEREVLEVLGSKWVSMGPKTEEYERALREFYGVNFALSFNTGTSALLAAYRSVNLQRKVIVPSLTFVATVNALVFLNLEPVFSDIHSLNYPLISAEEIEKVLDKDVSGVVYVNYAGYSLFVDEIRELCEDRGLILIEDASHAHGAVYKGKFAGTWGKIGAFSTFANKNLSTGEGGYILTDDPEIYKRAKLFRSHGMSTSSWERFREGKNRIYDVLDLGLNLRPSELQSAIGLANLRKLREENRKREKLVSLYRELILEELPEVLIPFLDIPVEASSHYIFPIILPKGVNRNKVAERLAEMGISTSVHYPPVHLFSFYNKGKKLPKTEEYSSRTLTLPLWGNMGEEKVYMVVEGLKKSI